MPLTEGFVEFTAIIEAGSISAAARDLGMSRATVNRHLDELETRLGTRLLHRSTRKISPTRAGQELYRRTRRIVDQAREATLAVRALDDTPRGLLRVSVPADTELFGPPLLAFVNAYPEITLELDASSAHQDLVAEQFDVAIRAGRVRDGDLFARRLWAGESGCMASPDYIARRGMPTTVEELAEHDLLLAYDAGRTPQRTWPLVGGGQVPVKGRMASNSLSFLVQACGLGHGIVFAPTSFQGPMGGVVPVRVLEGIVGAQGEISVVWSERQFQQPKVRAFVDHMVEWAQRTPIAPTGGVPAPPSSVPPNG